MYIVKEFLVNDGKTVQHNQIGPPDTDSVYLGDRTCLS